MEDGHSGNTKAESAEIEMPPSRMPSFRTVTPKPGISFLHTLKRRKIWKIHSALIMYRN